MVKTPRTRHSKSRREPLTIELDPADVARVPEEEALPSTAAEAESPDSIPASAEEATVVEAEAPAAIAGEAETPVSESDFATETGTATQPEQEYQPAEALQEATGSRLDEAEHRQAEPDGPQAPSVSPPAQPRRDGFSRVAAGLIGAAIALAGAAGLQYAGLLGVPGATSGSGPAAADIESLRQEIASVRSSTGAQDLGTRIDGVAASLDAVKAEVASLRETASSGAGGGDGAGLQALDARIKEIEASIATLGQAGAPDGGALTALGDRLSAIEAQTKTQGDAVAESDKRIAGLEQSIGTLTGRVDAQAQQPKIALAIATAALKAAVERGAPFTAELEAVAAIAPDAPGIAALRTLAEQGVPTKEDLLAEVEPAAAAMIEASRPVDPNAGILDRLMQSAESLVTVRPIGAVEGSGVPEIVARMQAAMAAGDLDKAIAEFDTLPDAAKAAAGTFAGKLKARRDAVQLVNQAIAGAMKA